MQRKCVLDRQDADKSMNNAVVNDPRNIAAYLWHGTINYVRRFIKPARRQIVEVNGQFTR